MISSEKTSNFKFFQKWLIATSTRATICGILFVPKATHLQVITVSIGFVLSTRNGYNLKCLTKLYFRFGMSYVNLITSSIYSVNAQHAFIVNLFKGQVMLGSIELAVGAAVIC